MQNTDFSNSNNTSSSTLSLLSILYNSTDYVSEEEREVEDLSEFDSTNSLDEVCSDLSKFHWKRKICPLKKRQFVKDDSLHLNNNNDVKNESTREFTAWEKWVIKKMKEYKEVQQRRKVMIEKLKNEKKQKELEKLNKKKLFDEMFPEKVKIWNENLKRLRQNRIEKPKETIVRKSESQIKSNFKKWLKEKLEKEKLKEERLKEEALLKEKEKIRRFEMAKNKFQAWCRDHKPIGSLADNKKNHNNNADNTLKKFKSNRDLLSYPEPAYVNSKPWVSVYNGDANDDDD